MENVTTDKLSLLYKTDTNTIQKKLEEYYKINIEEIYQIIQSDLAEKKCTDYLYSPIDKIFDTCYEYVKELECKKAIVRQKYFRHSSSPSSVFTEFKTQLKRHALLISTYTLEDQKRTETILLSDPLHKNTAKNILNDFAEGIFDINDKPYLENNQEGVSYYCRDFLLPLTVSFLNNYKKKQGPKKFHIRNDIKNIENKRLTKLLKEKFQSLIEFQQLIQYDICCSKHQEYDQEEVLIEALNTYYKLLYFQKLESLTGASTLLFLLPYITHSAEDKELYESIANNKIKGESDVLPDIEDAVLFQTMPNIFDRSTLIQKYYDKEITRDELYYLRDRVIPLITNSFFCVFCKSYANPQGVLKNYLKHELVHPREAAPLSDEEIIKLIPQFNTKKPYFDETLYDEITEDTYIIDEEKTQLTLERALILEKLTNKSLRRLPGTSEWYSTWSDTIFYISTKHNEELDPETSYVYNVIMNYIDGCDMEERLKVLRYFFDNYASHKWFAPSSQLPNTKD